MYLSPCFFCEGGREGKGEREREREARGLFFVSL
jgi:hypothetical protein